MANKKQKKPRHTNLVLPGERKRESPAATDRLGRTPAAASSSNTAAGQPTATPAEKPAEQQTPAPPQKDDGIALMASSAAPQPAEDPKRAAAGAPADKPKDKRKARKRQKALSRANKTAAAKPAGPPGTAPQAEQALPPGAIVLPKRPKKRLSPVKRKRRRRRIRIAVVLLLVAVGFIFYQSGSYLTAATLFSDIFESLQVAAWGGDGFPMDFAVNGFIKAEPMGNNGFAALGDRDAAIVSSAGRETLRIQHSYLSPGLSAGGSRIVVYSRGGREYTVESRTKNVAKITTLQDILFCEMSPGGWLAQVTSSRFSSTLTVMDPTYDTQDPNFKFDIVDETPVLASFHTDNRHLLLGCLLPGGGTLGSTLYLLHTGRDEVQATIHVQDARLLRAEFLSGSRIVAVYDRFCALYNTAGEELARYDYGAKRLLTSDVGTGGIALVFGSSAQERVQVARLSTALEVVYEVETTGATTPTALVADELYLLTGQQVLAYDAQGTLVGNLPIEPKSYTLVQGGRPLLLCAGSAFSLQDLFRPPHAGSSAGQAGSSAPAAPSSASAPPSSSPSASSEAAGPTSPATPDTSDA